MNNNETAIKKTASDMFAESRTYITMSGLKSREKLAALLEGHPLDEQHFTPMELFFIVETMPGLKTAVSDKALQDAYCAALKQLPADWWGLPSSTKADVAQHLLAVPDIEICLDNMLADTSPLQYEDGESNTLAIELQWQRGDLAAGLIAAVYNEEFDFRAPLEERLKARDKLHNNT